jgi:hypothetical protein
MMSAFILTDKTPKLTDRPVDEIAGHTQRGRNGAVNCMTAWTRRRAPEG